MDVASARRAWGYVLRPTHPFPDIRVHSVQRVLQALAAVAAGLLLLEWMAPSTRAYGAQPLALLGPVFGLLALGRKLLSVQAAAGPFGGMSVFYGAEL